MAKTYNRLELDVNKNFSGMITEVQGDANSRYLDVSLFNNGVPLDLTGHEVKIFMVKPENGGEIWNDGVITDATAGRCEFLMTTEALSKVGHLQAQISVWKDNTEILSTRVFEIYVTKTLLGNSSVESSNEYGTLVVLFQNLYEAHDLMTKMVESFGEAGKIAAELAADTFWKMLEAVYQVNADALKNASVSEVLDRIGTTSDTGGTATAGTAMAKLNELLSKNTSVIRHIQRGKVWMYVTDEVSDKKTIKLSGFTNVDKMVVLLNGSLEFAPSGADSCFCVLTYLESLTTTELVISTSYFLEVNRSTSSGDIGYQVIEFY